MEGGKMSKDQAGYWENVAANADDGPQPVRMRFATSAPKERPCGPRRKLTQDEAGYVPPPDVAFKCATCMHFQWGGCAIVEGTIEANGCCNEWERPGVPLNPKHVSGRDVEDILKGTCNKAGAKVLPSLKF